MSPFDQNGEPKPPPWWDVAIFKAGGAVTLLVALVDPWLTGEPRDWRLIGLGMVAIGGRELAIAVVQAFAGRGR